MPAPVPAAVQESLRRELEIYSNADAQFSEELQMLLLSTRALRMQLETQATLDDSFDADVMQMKLQIEALQHALKEDQW